MHHSKISPTLLLNTTMIPENKYKIDFEIKYEDWHVM